MRISNSIATLLMSLALLILAQCAQKGQQVMELPPQEPARLMAAINANRSALTDLSGVMTLIIHSSEGQTAVGVNVSYLKPDDFKFEFKGPFGINLGQLIISQQNYWVSNHVNGEESQGDISSVELPFGFSTRFKPAVLFSLLLPIGPNIESPDSISYSTDTKAALYKLAWKDSSLVHSIWVDPYLPIIMREVIETLSGDTLVIKETDDVKASSGIYVPEAWKTQLGVGKDAIIARVNISSLKVNQGLTSDLFFIPALTDSVKPEQAHE
jgi:outer membrane lipoprotein-sorting protein